MVTSSTVRGEERRAAILAALAEAGSLQLDAIAAELGVSSMTVRRDLDELEAEGLLRRVRGGAVSVGGPRPFSERRGVRLRAKQAIAAKAALLVPARGAIALDASSTAGTFAETLLTRAPAAHATLTVATNSYDNFSTLRGSSNLTPVLIGGEPEATTGSFVGKIACDAAASMLYQCFFTSATAVDAAHGSSEVSLAESQVKQAFARRSRRVILCVDSSKLDQLAVAVGFEWPEISAMITELDPGDARLAPYRELTEIF